MSHAPAPAVARRPSGRRAGRGVSVRVGRTGGRAVAVVAAVALSAGCSIPALEGPDDQPSAREAPLAAEPPDPSEQRVRRAVDDLLATLDAARQPLTAATDAADAAAVRRGADAALAALVRGAGDGSTPDTGALFPAETGERGATADADDRLTLTLTAARESGTPGAQLADLLRDPLAGDLGAWQRDAAGVLTSLSAVADPTASLEQLEQEIGQVAGLGPRAIAWSELAAGATDRERGVAFSERAAANLEVIVLTMERFVEGLDEDTAERPLPDAGDPEASAPHAAPSTVAPAGVSVVVSRGSS